jgi:predicted phosphodiesterase
MTHYISTRIEEQLINDYGETWQNEVDFVINVGDIVETGSVISQYTNEYFEPFSNLTDKVPFYVSIGNHERDAKWFYRYVSYPGNENYYSFDYGNAHFTIVDSNKDLSPGSKEYEWIKNDLASSNAKWKFVAHHHPPYSSDSNDYGNTAYGLSERMAPEVVSLIPLYEEYGVDVVWCGHIHDYERTWPIREGEVDEGNGVIYIQAGGGGAELEDFAPTRSWFTAKLLRNWQYCLVTIHDGTFRMMAYDIDGKMYDYLELKKY